MDEGEAGEREKALKTGINHYLQRLTRLSPLEQLEQIKGDLQFDESCEIVPFEDSHRSNVRLRDQIFKLAHHRHTKEKRPAFSACLLGI